MEDIEAIMTCLALPEECLQKILSLLLLVASYTGSKGLTLCLLTIFGTWCFRYGITQIAEIAPL